ncbi:hypothetical protein C8F04DRAFT_1258998 [Mycena alexandri]|uniref:Uncharacterized protein n=1 Tax=Mycena alexandri TaxID=1745969 RepID=A0AAD6X596_9AGAR|nr:hypothetical protein C8F04DRAFT_1258998 [Mycena alexandri]
MDVAIQWQPLYASGMGQPATARVQRAMPKRIQTLPALTRIETSEGYASFYQRFYVPGENTLVMGGDIRVALGHNTDGLQLV